MNYSSLFKIFFIKIALLLFLSSTAQSAPSSPLVNSGWVNDRLEQENVIVLDIRNSREFGSGTIPGALNSPYGKAGWRVSKNNVPGVLPEKAQLESLFQGLGINENSEIVVVYGGHPRSDFGSAARVYWTLKVGGLQNVSVLNGGIKAWVNDGHKVSQKYGQAKPSDYKIQNLDSRYYASQDEVKENLSSGKYLAIDARPDKQYFGYEKHKASSQGGTIPNAENISQFSFLEKDTFKLIPKNQITSITSNYDIDGYEGVVSFCNTGHWAATNWFVFSEVLGNNTKLYDGSMVEWTANKDNPLDNVKNRIQLLWYELTKDE